MQSPIQLPLLLTLQSPPLLRSPPLVTLLAKILWDHTKEVLTFNMPAGAGFTGGLLFGMGATAGTAGTGVLVASIGARVAAGGFAATGGPAVLIALRQQLGLDVKGDGGSDGAGGEDGAATAAIAATGAARGGGEGGGGVGGGASQQAFIAGDIPRAEVAFASYLEQYVDLPELRAVESELRQRQSFLQQLGGPGSDADLTLLSTDIATVEKKKAVAKKLQSTGWF